MGHYDNCRDDHIPEVGKMVLVPREPTPEMRRAANDCAAKFNPGRSTDHIGSVAFDAQSIYRAMVDAAPQPSQSENISALRERLGGIGIDQMGTDNLAISLATYFDDGEEPNEHPAWSDAAIAGANALLDAIHAHYEPLLNTLSADNARLREELEKTIAGANILLADSRQCSIQHHHVTWFDERPPGWWADIQKDVLASRQFLDSQGGGNG